MKKSLSKTRLFVLIIIAIILITTLSGNIFLIKSKNGIEQELSKYLSRKVFIGSAYYLPPNFIILRNVSMSNYETTEKIQLFSVESIEKIKLVFSLGNLTCLPCFAGRPVTGRISGKEFKIVRLYFYKPKVNVSGYDFFLKESANLINGLIGYLADEKAITLIIENGLLVLPQKEKLDRYIVIDATLKVKPDKSLSSEGYINLEHFLPENNTCLPRLAGRRATGKIIGINANSAINPSLNYKFKVQLTKEGLMMENLELNITHVLPLARLPVMRGSQVYLKLWGGLEKNLLRLNGFSFLEMPYPYKSVVNIVDRLRRKLVYNQKTIPQLVWIFPSGVNILDLGCVIELDFPNIKIKNLSFSFKNMPFCLKGSISLLKQGPIDLKFSSFPNQAVPDRLKNPKRFDIEIAGILQDGKFNGKVSVDFLRKMKDKLSLSKIDADFKNLALYFAENKQVKASIENANLSYLSGGNLPVCRQARYEFFFKNFNAIANLENKRFKFVEFNSVICDGFLEGKGTVDIGQIPVRSFLNLTIKDVSVNQFSPVSIYSSGIYGKLRADISYKNYPSSNLYGKLMIEDGLLDKLIFFNWLAKFFNIPSIEKVNFNEISADFSIDEKAASLNRIKLDAEEMKLGGYFYLLENDLVSSRFSLSLSKELLDTSPKFKFLLKLLGENASYVKFDFQLSGLLESMNFKWLESDFKRDLQNLLSPTVERTLERNIEDVIKSISTNE